MTKMRLKGRERLSVLEWGESGLCPQPAAIRHCAGGFV